MAMEFWYSMGVSVTVLCTHPIHTQTQKAHPPHIYFKPIRIQCEWQVSFLMNPELLWVSEYCLNENFQSQRVDCFFVVVFNTISKKLAYHILFSILVWQGQDNLSPIIHHLSFKVHLEWNTLFFRGGIIYRRYRYQAVHSSAKFV